MAGRESIVTIGRARESNASQSALIDPVKPSYSRGTSASSVKPRFIGVAPKSAFDDDEDEKPKVSLINNGPSRGPSSRGTRIINQEGPSKSNG